MLGDGYSPGFEGPGPSFVGEDPRGRKAVLPGDSEQEDSEPESSWRRRLMSSSCPERFIEAIDVCGCKLGLGLSAVPTTSNSESSVLETVELSADMRAGSGCDVFSSGCRDASNACL